MCCETCICVFVIDKAATEKGGAPMFFEILIL